MSEARRQKLWLIMFSLILFGVIAVAHVFVASWHTPANASTDSIRFDTATLADGQFAVVDLDKESKTGFKLFIMSSNEMHIKKIQTKLIMQIKQIKCRSN